MARLTRTTAGKTLAAVYRSYERRAAAAAPGSDDDWRRDHMGASILGHKCDRFIWLSWRWAAQESVEGRMLRLWETGKREELRVVENLRAAGIVVHEIDDNTGDQWRIKFAGGHGGGSLDGIIDSLPDSDNEHVLEVKTHSTSSFAYLVAKGLRSAKPEHYAQMQLYMSHRGIPRGLYVAVEKNTDEIYMERIKLDQATVDKLTGKASDLIASITPPAKQLDKLQPPCLYTSRDGRTYPCRFWALCHEKQSADRNCRTCISSTPIEGGAWACTENGSGLSSMEQRDGCAQHCTIPQILNASVVSVHGRKVTVQFDDGEVRYA